MPLSVIEVPDYSDIDLIPERTYTKEVIEKKGVDLTPEKQYKLYKNAISPFAEGKQYEPSSHNFRSRTLSEWEQIPENERSAHRMSISDIEMAAKGNTVTKHVSEAEVIGSIRGSTGHDIVLLVNQFMLATMRQEPLPHVPLTLPSFKKTILPTLDEIFMSTALRKYWDNPDTDTTIHPTEVIDFVEESWRNIRKLHQFTNFSRNRRVIEDGEQFSSEWVQSYWFDDAQTSFEKRIFDIERHKINAYIENPLFEGDPYLFIPLPMHPDMYVGAEEDARKRMNFGEYSIQFTGRIDYHLRNPEREIYIDKKFGNYDSLRTDVTEAQVLAYCYALNPHAADYSPYTGVTPVNSFFYDDWYDVWGDTQNSYLVDLTIESSRLESTRANLARFTKTWHNNLQDFKNVKNARERAFIVPFLG